MLPPNKKPDSSHLRGLLLRLIDFGLDGVLTNADCFSHFSLTLMHSRVHVWFYATCLRDNTVSV